MEIPRPLPAAGARVRVTGTLSGSYTRASSGVVTDLGGILSFESLAVLKAAPEPAVLGKRK